MVSQLLFGEAYEITEKKQAWHKIITEFDHYTGWIDKKTFNPVSTEYYKKLEKGGYAVAYPVSARLLAPDQTTLLITAGSTLGHIDSNGVINVDSHVYRLAVQDLSSITGHNVNLVTTAEHFLNSPYLWGGRSPFGFDCSGFTQIVYKINGIRTPRDAWQQADTGQSVHRIKELSAGDLVFFSDKGKKVVHVGLAIPPDRIIHCSGMVRIDKLDEKGIFNQQLCRYTHRLHSMRRIKSI